ncbi:hypothetical protein P5G50_01420 [Leifsonia sp. F6_8S_P_1B]|uniref:Alpha-tubulin suppressor n=1 Tax=Leifsonia williamsii TaxID=3035919 RepID=A0ABT8K9D4_9MICO|nr:hypothetical protein [Leifsonia williamsii]MDN4613097.1 hypothetical protein [Leifsonia williamsii]
MTGPALTIRAALAAGTVAVLAALVAVTPTTAAFVDDAAAQTALATTPPRDVAFTDVEAGLDHTLALSSDGKVYGWGRNTHGQVGDPVSGNFTTRPAAIAVTPHRVTGIDAGRYVSIALDETGAVYTWGASTATTAGSTPTRVGGLPANIAGVSAGAMFFLAWTTDGRLYSWGDNASGKLGRGVENVTDLVPGQVTAAGVATGIAGADAGRAGGVAWRASGTVYQWGEGRWGAPGMTTGGVPAGAIATAVQGSETTMLLMASGALYYALGAGAFQAQTAITGVTRVAANHAETHDTETFMATTSAGTLYAWWDNGVGRFGDGTTTRSDYPRAISLAAFGSPRLSDISAGVGHSAVLTEAGTPLLTGANSYGQLGVLGSLTNSATYIPLAPVAVWP